MSRPKAPVLADRLLGVASVVTDRLCSRTATKAGRGLSVFDTSLRPHADVN